MNAARARTEQSTLLHAIHIEARNGAIYESLAGVFRGFDESVAAIFEEMAEEEGRHRVQLEARHRERFGPVLGGSKSEGPKDVIERVDLDDSEAFLFDSMTVEQALEAGLKAELEAQQFYAREADRTSDPDLARAYRELASFEDEHGARLRAKLADLREGSAGHRA